MNSSQKHVPKDGQVIMSILRELDVQDYEPRVINQLLEFVYRYVTCVLDDAKIFANHARKKTIELSDVRLACEAILDKSFTAPPPRQVLSRLSEMRNITPLPPVKPHCGLRLPPDRYCLSGTNYKLKLTTPLKKVPKVITEQRPSAKGPIKLNSPNPSNRRPNVPGSKSQVIAVPKPMFKLSTASKTSVASERPPVSINICDSPEPVEKMDVDPEPPSNQNTNRRSKDRDKSPAASTKKDDGNSGGTTSNVISTSPTPVSSRSTTPTFTAPSTPGPAVSISNAPSNGGGGTGTTGSRKREREDDDYD